MAAVVCLAVHQQTKTRYVHKHVRTMFGDPSNCGLWLARPSSKLCVSCFAFYFSDLVFEYVFVHVVLDFLQTWV